MPPRAGAGLKFVFAPELHYLCNCYNKNSSSYARYQMSTLWQPGAPRLQVLQQLRCPARPGNPVPALQQRHSGQLGLLPGVPQHSGQGCRCRQRPAAARHRAGRTGAAHHAQHHHHPGRAGLCGAHRGQAVLLQRQPRRHPRRGEHHRRQRQQQHHRHLQPHARGQQPQGRRRQDCLCHARDGQKRQGGQNHRCHLPQRRPAPVL